MGYKNSDNTNNKFSRKSMSPSFTGGKGRKTVGKKVKKTIPRKTVTWSSYNVNSDSNEDSDEDIENDSDDDDEDEDEDEDDETEHHHLDGLYSLIGKKPQDSSSNDDDEDEKNNKNIFSSTSSDGDSDEAMFSSSDDDSDVDFVKLQAQQKAHALKVARARKGLKSKPKNESNDNAIASSSDSESEPQSDSDNEDDVASMKKLKPRKTSFLKYGRRRSDAVLPDINFKFEFDTGENEEVDADHQQTHIREPEEEDIGEEVDYSPEIPVDSTNVPSLEFEFDHHLIDVPKINEEELNSDEDYEIDDNELLATLQAENDADEFLPPIIKENDQPHRNDSLISSSIEEEEERNNGDDDDDDENDPFLKEEEKYLVNEFETNGFDENENEEEDEDDLHTFDSDFSTTNRIVNSFKGIGEDRSKPIVKYESSASGGSDYDEDDYIDLINFDVPLFDDKNGSIGNGTKSSHHKGDSDKLKKDKIKQRSNSNHNSDEDDDSYLWNYFFSSDNESSSEEADEKNNNPKPVIKNRKNKQNKKALSTKAITGADELFEQIENDNTFKSKTKPIHHGNSLYKAYSDSPMTIQELGAGLGVGSDDDDNYDSSESTDVDESLPKSSSNNSLVGSSKKATEVLSSKTADYRPPKLGSWVTVDCKPFGVIDGLSTRTLQLNKSQEPRSAVQSGASHSTSIVNSPNGAGLPTTSSMASSLATNSRKSIVVGPTNASLMISSDDLALGLDELLNVSELDNDDENDVKIWRDFNNNQNKKKIPLGAFRNKSVLYNNHIYQDNDNNHHLNHRHSNVDKKFNGSGHIKKQQPIRRQSQSKIERRRASIVEAVSQGYRPTKSGLFSETALADVEELFGDDRDLMELIQGL